MPHPAGGKAPTDASKCRNLLPKCRKSGRQEGRRSGITPTPRRRRKLFRRQPHVDQRCRVGGSVACGRSLVWYAFSKPLITSRGYKWSQQFIFNCTTADSHQRRHWVEQRHCRVVTRSIWRGSAMLAPRGSERVSSVRICRGDRSDRVNASGWFRWSGLRGASRGRPAMAD